MKGTTVPVKANSGEISLTDLLQVKGTSPGSSRVTIDAPAGPGVLAIVDGRFVFAEYDGLAGEPAAYRLLMLDGSFDYELRTNVEVRRRNMDVACQRFLISSVRFKSSFSSEAGGPF